MSVVLVTVTIWETWYKVPSYHHWPWTLLWCIRLQETWLSSYLQMLWDNLKDCREEPLIRIRKPYGVKHPTRMLAFTQSRKKTWNIIRKRGYLEIPAVRQETTISMSRAITARCWAGWALSFKGLPGERSAVKQTFLLAPCCKWTPVGTAVGGILPTDVAQTVTAWNWTPGNIEMMFKSRD